MLIYSVIHRLIFSCLFTFLFLLSSPRVFGQVSLASDTTVFTIVECQPEFPGGIVALVDYLKQRVNYPLEAQRAKIKGRAFVSFVVERDGRLTQIQVLKGLGYGCDEEAIRVVNMMPKWQPGSQSGILIRVKYNLPVAFGLEYGKGKGD
ncbi:hypothetical protein GCM10028805_31740 [Spirosoma harenae]